MLARGRHPSRWRYCLNTYGIRCQLAALLVIVGFVPSTVAVQSQHHVRAESEIEQPHRHVRPHRPITRGAWRKTHIVKLPLEAMRTGKALHTQSETLSRAEVLETNPGGSTRPLDLQRWLQRHGMSSMEISPTGNIALVRPLRDGSQQYQPGAATTLPPALLTTMIPAPVATVPPASVATVAPMGAAAPSPTPVAAGVVPAPGPAPQEEASSVAWWQIVVFLILVLIVAIGVLALFRAVRLRAETENLIQASSEHESEGSRRTSFWRSNRSRTLSEPSQASAAPTLRNPSARSQPSSQASRSLTPTFPDATLTPAISYRDRRAMRKGSFAPVEKSKQSGTDTSGSPRSPRPDVAADVAQLTVPTSGYANKRMTALKASKSRSSTGPEFTGVEGTNQEINV